MQFFPNPDNIFMKEQLEIIKIGDTLRREVFFINIKKLKVSEICCLRSTLTSNLSGHFYRAKVLLTEKEYEKKLFQFVENVKGTNREM